VIHGRNHKPDVGRYHCEAVNPYGRAISNNATLEIASEYSIDCLSFELCSKVGSFSANTRAVK
jgi:hypothetical protein